ncbi:MAG: DUF5683 domain-containing protein [Cyclobacteriaceae bacterium]
MTSTGFWRFWIYSRGLLLLAFLQFFFFGNSFAQLPTFNNDSSQIDLNRVQPILDTLQISEDPIFLADSIKSLTDKILQGDTIFLDETGEALKQLADETSLFTQQSALDPQVAAIYSAVLPGLGQIYNKQYYKLPFIYGGGMLFIHLIKRNNQLYRSFRNALFNEIDLDPNTNSPFPDNYAVDALRRNTDQFRRDRDFYIIVGLLWYGLNIVDAHVSAHLDEFDVNDELSLKMSPTIMNVPTAPHSVGLAIALNFK